MEKPSHRTEYENLLAKQERERANLRDEAHEEASVTNEAINEREIFATLDGRPCKIIALPEMEGKYVSDVYAYIQQTQGKEKLAEKVNLNLSRLPEELKVKNRKYFLLNNLSLQTPVSYEPDGSWSRERRSREKLRGGDEVDYFSWGGTEWYRSEEILGDRWDTNSRVVVPLTGEGGIVSF